MNSILLQIRTCKVPAAGGAGVGRNQIDHYHEGNKRNQGLRLISALMGRLWALVEMNGNGNTRLSELPHPLFLFMWQNVFKQLGCEDL